MPYRIGRNWMAIRDMDTAASVIGIRVARSKLVAFAVSSFYCGVAGALWAFAYLGTVDARKSLSECGGFAVRSVDGGVQRDLGGRHLLCGADVLRGLFQKLADLFFGGVPLQDLGEEGQLVALDCLGGQWGTALATNSLSITNFVVEAVGN